MNIGLCIIGDEILTGRRQDKHLQAVIEILRERGMSLNWVRILSDDLSQLLPAFEQTFASGDLVFSTGGIGGTPDDLTRLAVAQVTSLPLQPHPEGLAILREKFAEPLTAERQRMVEFPQGAQLIPNPVNRVPGFALRRHYFVPGFPDMSWPMIRWVLDNHYPQSTEERPLELAIRVMNTPESSLIELMESILAEYPGLKIFSLPSTVPGERMIELGVRGKQQSAKSAMHYIKARLDSRQIEWLAIK